MRSAGHDQKNITNISAAGTAAVRIGSTFWAALIPNRAQQPLDRARTVRGCRSRCVAQSIGRGLVDSGRPESPCTNLVIDGRGEPVPGDVIVGIIGVVFGPRRGDCLRRAAPRSSRRGSPRMRRALRGEPGRKAPVAIVASSPAGGATDETCIRAGRLFPARRPPGRYMPGPPARVTSKARRFGRSTATERGLVSMRRATIDLKQHRPPDDDWQKQEAHQE